MAGPSNRMSKTVSKNYTIPKINTTDTDFESNLTILRNFVNNDSSNIIMRQVRNCHAAAIKYSCCHWYNMKQCKNRFDYNNNGLISCIDIKGMVRVHACRYCIVLLKLPISHRCVSCPILKLAKSKVRAK